MSTCAAADQQIAESVQDTARGAIARAMEIGVRRYQDELHLSPEEARQRTNICLRQLLGP